MLLRLTNEAFSIELHLKDSTYTHNILAIFDQLLDGEMDEMQFYVLLVRLYEYGRQLGVKHAEMSYLRSFSYEGHSIRESFLHSTKLISSDFSVAHQKSVRSKRHTHKAPISQINLSDQSKDLSLFRSLVRRNCRLASCKGYGLEILMLRLSKNERLKSLLPFHTH